MNNSTTLKNYLKAVLDAELNCYTYDCTIERFKREKRKYERKPIVNKPSLQSTDFSVEGLGALIVIFLVSWLIGFIIMGILVKMSFDSLKNTLSTNSMIFILFGIPVILGIIVIILIIYKDISDTNKYNKHETQQYTQNLKMAEQQIKEDSIRIQRISSQINQLAYGRSMAYKQREKLYSLNIIHSDYRELTKISKMYEYLDIGICYELEGGLGAYAKCREEMIWASFHDLLVAIKNDLSELKGICYSLYDGITESNKKMNYLCEGMNETLRLAAKTEQNTAIAAYNSEISANENRIQTNMMIYSALIK